MKKLHTLLFVATTCVILFTACNTKPKTAEAPVPGPGGTESMYYPDSVLNKYVWRVFKNSYGHFMVPYNANVTVDSNTTPPTLSTLGQAGSYTTIASVSTEYTTQGTELTSTAGNIGADTTRSIIYLGPFSPTSGYFYCSSGQLHYLYNSGKDSTLTYMAQLIWMGQSGSGGGIAIGYVSQMDVSH